MKLKWQARDRVRLLCSHPAWGPDTSQEIIHNWHWRSGKKTFIDKVKERQALFIKISYHSWVWEAAALTLSEHQQYVSLKEHLSLFWMRLVRVMPAAEQSSLMDQGLLVESVLMWENLWSASVPVYHADGGAIWKMESGIFSCVSSLQRPETFPSTLCKTLSFHLQTKKRDSMMWSERYVQVVILQAGVTNTVKVNIYTVTFDTVY